MKIVEHTYPIVVLCVIYVICACRDLRKTNDLQDLGLEEVNKSLLFLIESISKDNRYNNNNSKIEESEITKKHHVHKKKDDQHKVSTEDLVHPDETKEIKSKPMNSGRRDDDVSLTPINQYYRKSFGAANRNKNKKETKKEIWTKQKSRKAMASQDPEDKERYLIPSDQSSSVQSEYPSFYPTQAFDDDDYFIMSDDISDIHNDEKDIYHTSCVLTNAVMIPPCYNYWGDFWCSEEVSNGRCTDTAQYCEKSCDACLPPVSLFENQIQHKAMKNIISTFNLSLNVTTDRYANETTWLFTSQDNEDTIFNSNETNTTSQLVNNTDYIFSYSCFVSQNKEKNLKTKSICYDFELHDSYGDGLCCEYGGDTFSMTTTTKNNTLSILDKFEDGSLISTSLCIDLDHGEIENKELFITKDKPTHYPRKRYQCKNNVCICDSKPLLFSSFEREDIYDFHMTTFLLEVTMLSDPKFLQDVESAQYKAACWVLYDDPYEYDFTNERLSVRMIQRYILAVLYFATSPENWEEHYNFLSSHSECDWSSDYYSGISCDEDDNVIGIDLGLIAGFNSLDVTIVEELIGLRVLETLYLSNNNIHGTIPSVLGRLSELRYLDLGSNNLEGTIPEMIGNLQKLIELNLGRNNLSGSVPEALYTLKNLEGLYLRDNKLSSSISPLIGNLNKLRELWLQNNMLTGQISSTIGSLSSSKRVHLNNNTFSGSIPESLFDLHSLEKLSLQDNSVTGSIPSEFCDNKFIQADCQNDVFDPDVSCDCCTCTDDSPIWDGECADVTIKVVIDQRPVAHDEYSYTSDGLEWSLTNDATQKKIPLSPLSPEDGDFGGTACVAYSDCISIDMISPPIFNTYIQIYWNNVQVGNGIRKFPGLLELESTFEYKNDPFQFDEENHTLISCKALELEIACGYRKDTVKLEPDTIKRTIYNEVTRTSGRESIQDVSSSQSKALCSLLQNEKYVTTLEQIDVEFLQRYILLILHFMSPNGLFGNNEHLAEKHECEWNGIICKQNNETKIVTGISLSSAYSHIINGTLIDELGSLKYLEVLDFNQTQLYGTIPRSFSNLWSLTKLNLSGNKLSGTMPKTLFHQLNKLEHIDLSDNSLTGSINDDIGSLSRIRSLSLGKNQFSGSIPLDRFKYTNLEHLHIGENDFGALDFSLILNHKNLKTLDISSNFFKGSIPDHTFTSLQDLQYFNISQNDFSGTIPSTYSELSNISHFDAHANRLQGTIPLSISALSNIQYINLQGNKLTGSLPSELNQLEKLNTLVLSHNELKGSIPFDPTTLQNINRLHLQNNKLSGQAPIFSDMTSYITDCGFPSDSLDPVSCTSCNTCCNSDGACQSKSSEKLSQVHASLIFMFTIITFIIICYALKDNITSNRYLESFFVNTVSYWNALMLISDKSVYHFLLLENKICWYVAFLCGIFQSLTLFLFVHSADIVNETSDREYTMLCPANSLECEDSNKISSYGIFIFGLILTIWLLRDIVGSVKLMLVSFQKRDVDFFFTSGFVFSVTMLSLWSSIIYIKAIAIKNTDMIKDAVVLLFVVEIDERLFQLIESLNPDWVQKVDRNMRESLVYEGKDLVISSWMERYSAKEATSPSLPDRLGSSRVILITFGHSFQFEA